jgi:organic hydroperoxide reductase OsmC/OhrA
MSDRISTHHAKVVWRGDKRDLRAHEVHLADQTIQGSCAQTLGGDPVKADPEEMFVASLASCHMLWFLDFARRERLRVLTYEDEPEGDMDGSRFVRVVLRPSVGFEHDVAAEMVQRLHERAHEACFIANSVNCAVIVEPVGRR